MEPPRLNWSEEDVPVAVRFDDPYFSKLDGLAETEHTFLAGNNLPERLCNGFCICELGFGTGLNAAAVWAAWAGTGREGRIRFVSFEAYPMEAADIERALRRFPQVAEQAAQILDFVSGGGDRLETEDFALDLVCGDARTEVPLWQGRADAWFLDGFSPARNPELWEADLMRAVAEKTVPGGSFATYSAAGHVRRALEAAGFEVERCKGFGTKRHMSRGVLREV